MANYNRMYDRDRLLDAAQNNPTMAQAAKSVGLPYNTFKRYARKLGVYSPNQGGAGTSKPKSEGADKFPLQEILAGQHPTYSSNRLKKRLIDAGIKHNKCEKCGGVTWCGEEIPLELHHIDGRHTNHILQNLMVVCANCHAVIHKRQLRPQRGKVTDEEIQRALTATNGNIHQAVHKLELPVTGTSYERVKRFTEGN